MRSSNLTFDLDYLWSANQREDRMFNAITSDYMFKCDNYAVAYKFKQFLNNLKNCEYGDIVDDCFFPFSSIIFFTCRPQDALRMKYVAKRIPSSFKADVKIYSIDDETGEDIEI